MSTRDQILDAFETLIIDQGERSATLSAVAEHAGVSKGGLLYHFDSKSALAQGLIDRLEEFTADDVERIKSSDNPIGLYIDDSVVLAEPIDRTFTALFSLAQLETYVDARSALYAYDVRMTDAFHEILGDRVLAQLVVRVSDSYYSRAAVGLNDDDEEDRANIIALLQSLSRA